MGFRRGIRDAVLILRAGGVETFESCETGDSHSFLEPPVRFPGDSWVGYPIALANAPIASPIRPVSIAP